MEIIKAVVPYFEDVMRLPNGVPIQTGSLDAGPALPLAWGDVEAGLVGR
jgi:hypothetical protein